MIDANALVIQTYRDSHDNTWVFEVKIHYPTKPTVHYVHPVRSSFDKNLSELCMYLQGRSELNANEQRRLFLKIDKILRTEDDVYIEVYLRIPEIDRVPNGRDLRTALDFGCVPVGTPMIYSVTALIIEPPPDLDLDSEIDLLSLIPF